MSYNQHMKHWENHGKNRFYQQCGGPANHDAPPADYDALADQEKRSLKVLLERYSDDSLFPIYVSHRGWVWSASSEETKYSVRVDSVDELALFIRDYA